MPQDNISYYNYLVYIPLLPLIGVFINAFLGHALPKKLSGAIASAVVFGSFVFSVLAVKHLLSLPEDQRTLHQPLWDWISTGGLKTQIAFLLDPLSSVMILVVSGISFLIHVYSTGYMADEPRYSRFFTYLNLFTFSMLILVLADNFLLMFVGWEGVGLCSYLLIGFWFEKKSAADAGKKAFIVNRIGDFGFILGMSLIFATFGTLTFRDVFAQVAQNPTSITAVLTVICLLLFVGATGKSAQIPLYVWLPDAMEGPTPVSALIHAATMVTAGVYMVARCHLMFTNAPTAMLVVASIGAATAI
ncbi:MAG: NADH-quinone oxidoreductase subunit L, partial [Armatimonadota bacterium]